MSSQEFEIPNNKNKAKTRMEELRKEIRYHNKKYFVENQPEISDYEYDQLLRELEVLEEAYPEFITEDSPTQRVGSEEIEEFKTVEHKGTMLSLNKAFNYGELKKFDERVKKGWHNKTIEYVVEPKIDGLGVALYYKTKSLERAATRGDGKRGEDITPNVKTIKAVPLRLSDKSKIRTAEFRGEIFMPRKAFDEMNEKRIEQGREAFANPRNATAGTMRTKDPKTVAKRPLDIFIYTLSYVEDGNFETHTQTLEEMKRAGLKVNKYRVFSGIEDVITYLDEYKEKKEQMDYEIDGMVIKVNDLKAHEALGHTTHHPRWAIAYKYPPTRKTTKIKSIEIMVGRTGKLTPVAILNSIELSGTTVGRASLHNEKEIQRKDIRVGDTALIEKAGEIIPQVVKVIKDKRDGSETKFEMPHKCPICGSAAKKIGSDVIRRCVNAQCPAQVKQRIEHWGDRNAMDIDGLGTKLVNKLVEKGLANTIADLYELKLENLKTIERMGKKSSMNLLDSIAESKQKGLSRVVFGLGIPYVGDHIARVLAEHFNNIENLMSASQSELEQIDEIGPQIAESVVSFFQEQKNKELIDRLQEHNVKMSTKQEEHEQFLEGKKFVFTGALDNYTRDEASEQIRKYGGRATSTVSSETDFVVVGKKPGSKLTKAQKEGIAILDEETFSKMLKSQKIPDK
ncbi:MAG: DNA ligase [Promethearchaeota archaeon]|nr:MAG: DNA ligase [Candidatus Lokiarchaeota archaeon]